MKNRISRKEIADQTVQILKLKAYKDSKKKTVDLSAQLDSSVNNSIHYTPEMLQALLSEVPSTASEHSKSANCSMYLDVFNETTFSGAKTLMGMSSEKTVCLNFASAKNPGGGFLNGSQAQEEALTRASGLYSSLIKYMDMYYNNRKNKSSLYQDHIIYSPDVAVFRNDQDELIDRPWLTSVITAPAVNYGALSDQDKPLASQVMRQRIDMILAIAHKHGYKNLVLGAWGCGVFRNNPQHVAGYFRDSLTNGGRFENLFERIRFSVLDPSDRGTYNAFYKVLKEGLL